MKKNVLVTAHSGCMNTKMNSLEYIKKAIEMKVDIIEVDIRYSKDNKVILSHDEIDKAKIEEYLTLEEAIQLVKPHKNIKLNLDIKELDKFKVLEEVVEENKMLDRVFLSGAKPPTIKELNDKGIKLNKLVNYRLDIDRNKEIEYLEELVEDIKSLNVMGVNLHYPRASKELVEVFHRSKIFISVWTVDEEELMMDLIDMGVDSISTDNVDILQHCINIK